MLEKIADQPCSIYISCPCDISSIQYTDSKWRQAAKKFFTSMLGIDGVRQRWNV